MPFAAAWIDLEIIIVNKVREKKTKTYDITSMWNLKKLSNELIYETETNSQTENKHGSQKGKRVGEG